MGSPLPHHRHLHRIGVKPLQADSAVFVTTAVFVSIAATIIIRQLPFFTLLFWPCVHHMLSPSSISHSLAA